MTLTEKAKERVRFFLQDKNPAEWAIRVRSQGPKDFGFSLEPLSGISPLDFVASAGDFKVVFVNTLKETLEDAEIDYIETEWNRGFRVTFKETNPVASLSDLPLDWEDPKVKKIKALLDQEINPSIASHGGVAELLGLKDNYVYLRMGGGCQGCASSQATLRNGIEMRIKEEVPEILGVIDQTDHAAGANPYFQ